MSERLGKVQRQILDTLAEGGRLMIGLDGRPFLVNTLGYSLIVRMSSVDGLEERGLIARRQLAVTHEYALRPPQEPGE